MKQITLLFIAFHFFGLTSAQSTIEGSVSDRITPLPWANIHIKNSTIGAISDEKGNFTLEAKKGDTLSISYTGYQTKEVVIDHQESIAVMLENESLDEVVVTAWAPRRISCGITCYTIIEITEETTNASRAKNTPSLYPNPSSDGIFNLKMANSYKEVQVFVTTILGQQIQSRTYQKTQGVISLDLSPFRTGVYLINFIADGEQLPTQKAIRG
ncbi:carboxypeptidase-like regulatory domain-containing protein [Dokdonia sp.]|uniref:carboxypeptidase-like regulatory domain-containing protein n=1 Tax=Dokdonia sp. TaxID=2024995 RepID=UPI00326308D8